GALAAPAALARLDLAVGEAQADGALLLAGAPPDTRRLTTAGPEEADDPEQLGRRVRGRLAVVRAGENPAARAAAAAAAGARAVLLAEPRADRPLAAIPAGRVAVPVLGVTGDAAAAVLEEEAGARVTLGPVAAPAGTGGDRSGDRAAARALSPFSSRGPTAAGRPKPELAAAGAARTALARGGGAVAGGTAIAAANVALAAAQLVRERPSATFEELRRTLAGGAAPDARLPARGAGAGLVRVPTAEQPVVARPVPAGRGDPCAQDGACARVTLRNRGATPVRLPLEAAADRGTRARLVVRELTIPPGGAREAEIGVAAAAGLATGRLLAGRALSIPFAVPVRTPPPPPLGALEPARDGGRVTGVAFALGAFDRGDPLAGGTRVELTERLELTLVRAGSVRAVRRLTPPGGARELLPGRYAYTLPRGTLGGLPRGRYAFRAVARAPRGGRPAVAVSEAFPR
ncbi:MAG TPA: S8 family serine peptidase, partial [Solirubrobacteraceae bacterium]|nr:S8 family serine peptidase [Solirubrobacteraceae bacterium]